MRATANTPDISFVISSRGTRRHLQRVLHSILCQSRTFSFEVVVGCPESAELLPDFAQCFLQSGITLRWVHLQTGNLSALRNRLYESARGRWVYFLDEDCQLPPDCVTRLVEILPRFANSACAGYYMSPSRWPLQRAYNSMANLWLKVHHNGVVLAGNFVLPKLDLPPPGFPFSLANGFGGEEVDLCENLRRHGIDVRHLRELSLFHYCAHPPAQFVSRAVLHGQAAYRPSRLGYSVGVLLRHLRDEKNPLVGGLVLFYVLMVRTTRLWTRLFPERKHSDHAAPELTARIDPYPGF